MEKDSDIILNRRQEETADESSFVFDNNKKTIYYINDTDTNQQL